MFKCIEFRTFIIKADTAVGVDRRLHHVAVTSMIDGRGPQWALHVIIAIHGIDIVSLRRERIY